MAAENHLPTESKAMLWTGRVLSFVPAAMLLLDGVMKIVKPAEVVKATVELGYSESMLVPLGIVLTLSAILYFIPKTNILGAVLLTGYLGGAVNTHVHAGHGLFQIVFPAIFGALLWIGLVLRDPHLRALTPIRSS